LAQQLAAAPVAQSDAEVNTHLMLDAGVLTKTLDDNREQLISQNMMTEGRSREESEASIDLLLEFIRNVKDAGLTLDQKDEQLNLQLRITVNP
jgi:DNA-binding transcriptional MerR regulator